MLNAITTSLEIDVMQASEIDQAVQLARNHLMPVLVVHPQLVAATIMTRARRQGRFKIITTIDWPKGDNYGMMKLRGMTKEMMQADGFEIMLTGGKQEHENKTEAVLISQFLRGHLSSAIEMRFVLGNLTNSVDNIVGMCKSFKDMPTPAFVRNDHYLKPQVTKANIKTHAALISTIKSVTGIPIKICGNIDSIRTIAGCIVAGASRFAVSLQQANDIISDIQRQPGELKELLDKEQTPANDTVNVLS